MSLKPRPSGWSLRLLSLLALLSISTLGLIGCDQGDDDDDQPPAPAVTVAPDIATATVNTNALQIDLATPSSGASDTPAFEIVDQPAAGNLGAISNDGSVIYTPDLGQAAGTVTFTYRRTDEGQEPDEGTVTVTVEANAAPASATLSGDNIANDKVELAESASATFTVTVGDANSNDGATVEIQLQPTLGTLVKNVTPASTDSEASFTYTAPETSGVDESDSFTLRATDLGGEFEDFNFEVVILGGDLAPQPTVDPSRFEVKLDQSQLIAVSANDPNPGDTHTFEVTTLPTLGTVQPSQNSDGMFTYTAGSAEGSDSFVVTVTDSSISALSGTVTVNVTVSRENGAPVADDAQFSTLDQNVTIDLTAISSDSDGPEAIFEIVTAPASGALDESEIGNGMLVYIPAVAGPASDTFTYRRSDNHPEDPKSDIGTVTLTIEENEAPAPSTTPNPIVVLENDASCTEVTIAANDPNASDSHTFDLIGTPQLGEVSPGSNSTGIFEYCSTGGIGADLFTIQVTDRAGLTGNVTVDVDVNEVDMPPSPSAEPNPASVVTDGSVQIAVSANDPNLGDSHSFEVTTSPATGSVTPTVSSDGLFTYTAGSSEGSASFVVTVTDNSVSTLSGTVTVNVNVRRDNAAPVADDAQFSTLDQNVTIDLTAISSDSDGPEAIFEIVTAPASGALDESEIGNGTLVYIPSIAGPASDTFTYRRSDNHPEDPKSDIGTVTLTIEENEAPAPSTTPNPIEANENDATCTEVTIVANDPNASDSHTFDLMGTPQLGEVSPESNSTGIFEYCSTGGIGADLFTIQVTDRAGLTGDVTVDVIVNEVDLPPNPSAEPNPASVAANGSVQITVNANDPNPADSHSFEVTSAPLAGSVTPTISEDGIFTYTGDGSTTGTQTFTITATTNAPSFLSESVEVSVEVTEVIPAFASVSFEYTGSITVFSLRTRQLFQADEVTPNLLFANPLGGNSPCNPAINNGALAGTTIGLNEDTDTAILALGGFNGSAGAVKVSECVYEVTGERVPQLGDFTVEVTEASDLDGIPLDLGGAASFTGSLKSCDTLNGDNLCD